MTPERLAWIRDRHAMWQRYTGNTSTIEMADLLPELFDHIDELTQQRDDAQRIAVASGIFQNMTGEAYDLDYDWRADPVGPVAWDKQR